MSTETETTQLPSEPHPSVLFGANKMAQVRYADASPFQVACALLTDSTNRKTLLDTYKKYQEELDTLTGQVTEGWSVEQHEERNKRLKFLRYEVTKPQYMEALVLEPASTSLQTKNGSMSLDKVSWELYHLRSEYYGETYVSRGLDHYPFKPPMVQSEDGERMVYEYVQGFHVHRSMFRFLLGEVNWAKLVLKLRQSVVDCARRFYEPSLKGSTESWTVENARYSVKNGKDFQWVTDEKFKKFMTVLLRCVRKLERFSLDLSEVYSVTAKIKEANDKNRLSVKKEKEDERLEKYKLQLKLQEENKGKKPGFNVVPRSATRPFKAAPAGTNQWSKPLEGVSVPSDHKHHEHQEHQEHHEHHGHHEHHESTETKQNEKVVNKYQQTRNKRFATQSRNTQRNAKSERQNNPDNYDHHHEHHEHHDHHHHENGDGDGDGDDGGEFQELPKKKWTNNKTSSRGRGRGRGNSDNHVPRMRR
jgi:hypothetical protein